MRLFHTPVAVAVASSTAATSLSLFPSKAAHQAHWLAAPGPGQCILEASSRVEVAVWVAALQAGLQTGTLT